MSKDLIQLGFMLERDDRDWFTKKCKEDDLSAAYVLSRYIKKCKESDSLDPFGMLANSDSNKWLIPAVNTNINNLLETAEFTQLVKESLQIYLSNDFANKILEEQNNTSITNLLEPIESRLKHLESIVNDDSNKMLQELKKTVYPLTERIDLLEQAINDSSTIETIVNNSVNNLLEPLTKAQDALKVEVESIAASINSRLDEKFKEHLQLIESFIAEAKAPKKEKRQTLKKEVEPKQLVIKDSKEFEEQVELLRKEGYDVDDTLGVAEAREFSNLVHTTFDRWREAGMLPEKGLDFIMLAGNPKNPAYIYYKKKDFVPNPQQNDEEEE